MIQAQDLRIGNWYNMSTKGNDNVHQITGKDIWEFELDPIDDIYYPIPLTEEDWKTLGEETDMLCDKSGFVIFKNGFAYQFIYTDYPYKHQIQNLYFALCGKELKIK